MQWMLWTTSSKINLYHWILYICGWDWNTLKDRFDKSKQTEILGFHEIKQITQGLNAFWWIRASPSELASHRLLRFDWACSSLPADLLLEVYSPCTFPTHTTDQSAEDWPCRQKLHSYSNSLDEEKVRNHKSLSLVSSLTLQVAVSSLDSPNKTSNVPLALSLQLHDSLRRVCRFKLGFCRTKYKVSGVSKTKISWQKPHSLLRAQSRYANI